MVVAPQAFFRYLAENTALIMTIYDRITVDESELNALIARQRSDAQPTVSHLRRQIEDFGIVERAAHADACFELSRAVVEVLSWLTRRQMLSSASVLRGHLAHIQAVDLELAAAVRGGHSGDAVLALTEVDGSIEKVRQLSQGNRESVVSEAQNLRAATVPVSAVERFATVRRLWELHLLPLRELVSVHGEMEPLLDRLEGTLNEGEQKFLAHGPLTRGFARTAARLGRMRRGIAADHHASIIEVAPLYNQLRRDSRWLLGASKALASIRAEGTTWLRLDERLGLMGWRTRYLLSDDKLRSRLAALVRYVPAAPQPIAEPPPATLAPLITHRELRDSLQRAVPVADVLAFILERWPAQPLTAQLCAFGHIVGGTFGPTRVSSDATLRVYRAQRVRIEAWPVALLELRT